MREKAEDNRLYQVFTPRGDVELCRGRTKDDALFKAFGGNQTKVDWYLKHCRIRRVYER